MPTMIGLACVTGLYVAAIIVSGGFDLRVGSLTIGSFRLVNPAMLYVLTLLAWLLSMKRPTSVNVDQSQIERPLVPVTRNTAAFVALIALCLLTSWTWHRSLLGGFIREDYNQINWVKDGAPWNGGPRYEPAWGTVFSRIIPLALSSYNWATSGLDPLGWHWTNILLHLLVSCLCGIFCYLIFLSRSKALIAAALFSVHPLAVECVTWISPRDSALAAAAVLASACSLVVGVRSGRVLHYCCSALFFACSLLCKESVLAVPLGIPLLAWIAAPEHGMRLALIRSLPHICLLAVYIMVQSVSGARWMPGSMWSIDKLIILPLGVAAPLLFPVNTQAIVELHVAARLVFAVILCGAPIVLLWRRRCLADSHVVVLLVWMSVLAIPVHKMIQLSATMQNGRYLYLSCTAFCPIVSHLLLESAGGLRSVCGTSLRGSLLALILITTWATLARLNNEPWVAAGVFSRRLASDLRTLIPVLEGGASLRISGLPEQFRGAIILYCVSIKLPLQVHYGVRTDLLDRIVELYHPDITPPPPRAGDREFRWTLQGFVELSQLPPP